MFTDIHWFGWWSESPAFSSRLQEPKHQRGVSMRVSKMKFCTLGILRFGFRIGRIVCLCIVEWDILLPPTLMWKKDSFRICGTDLGLLWILPPTSDESIAKHRRKNMGFEVKEMWAWFWCFHWFLTVYSSCEVGRSQSQSWSLSFLTYVIEIIRTPLFRVGYKYCVCKGLT